MAKVRVRDLQRDTYLRVGCQLYEVIIWDASLSKLKVRNVLTMHCCDLDLDVAGDGEVIVPLPAVAA